MKKFISTFTSDMTKPVIYSAISRFFLALCIVLLWNRFVNEGSKFAHSIFETGFFCAGIVFVLLAWFSYLSFDGFRPYANLFTDKDEEEDDRKGMSFTKIINTKPQIFEGFEDDERALIKLCSNLIVAAMYLIPSVIAYII
ncbi:MAG: hypothetical protein IKU13_03980 [Clostridia bacterium]|nr:hypothetical protein [Clostridia bacterium]